MKSILKDMPHYLVLLAILTIGLVGFFVFSFDSAFQIAILILVAISYVVWGLVHHAVHKDLYWGVVIEYVVVATLGLVIVFSLIMN